MVWVFAAYLRTAWKTTRWRFEGIDELRKTLTEDGPVVVVLWHERIAYSPLAFPARDFPICSLTSNARAGRFAGQVQAAFGFRTVSMDSRRGNINASRNVMRMMREGVSIGIAADGPQGPARVMKSVPIEWARTSGRPIYLLSYRVGRARRTKSWDRLIVPGLFTNGTVAFRRWDHVIPRKSDAEMREAARLQLERDLTAFTDETDADR